MPDITIGRLRGRYAVIWHIDGARRRYQLKARTRKEAEAEAIDVYRKHTPAPDRATVASMLEDYRLSLGEKPTARTVGYIMPKLCEHFGVLRADHITRDTCTSYTKKRTDEGRAIGTVHTELGHLRSALIYAEKTRVIPSAPHIWRPEKPTPKERYLSRDEITRLIDAAVTPHVRLAIILLLGTAGRVGAILDLKWSKVDFDLGVINLRLDDSRTRKGRAVVPMNGMTRAALQTAQDAALSDYVVEYACDRVKGIRTGFHAACRRADLEGVTIHTLRHTSAVYMAEAAIPMSKIAQYLGHSNTATTERVYARFAPSHMQDAADVLNFTEIRKARG